jgi:hypothetical protein
VVVGRRVGRASSPFDTPLFWLDVTSLFMVFVSRRSWVVGPS